MQNEEYDPTLGPLILDDPDGHEVDLAVVRQIMDAMGRSMNNKYETDVLSALMTSTASVLAGACCCLSCATEAVDELAEALKEAIKVKLENAQKNEPTVTH